MRSLSTGEINNVLFFRRDQTGSDALAYGIQLPVLYFIPFDMYDYHGVCQQLILNC